MEKQTNLIETDQTARPKRATLIGLASISVLSINMFAPALDDMATDFSTSFFTISLALGAYLAFTAIIQLVIGPVSDRFGRRPVVLTALAIFVLASCVCALAQNISVFLAFRFLQAGVACCGALSMVIVRDTHPTERVAGTIAYIGMAMAVAPLLGPIVGGILADVFGWRSIFWFFAAFGTINLVHCWYRLRETKPNSSAGTKSMRRSMMLLAASQAFWAFAMVTAFSTGAFFIFIAGAAIVADTVFQLTPSQTGLAVGSITGGFMFGSFLSGKYSQHFGILKMIFCGRLTALTGLTLGALLWVLGLQSSPYTYFGLIVLVGIGNGITMPNSNTGALSVNPKLAGTAAGLNSALNALCGGILTLVAGAVMSSSTGGGQLLFLMFFCVLVSLIAALKAKSLSPTRCE